MMHAAQSVDRSHQTGFVLPFDASLSSFLRSPLPVSAEARLQEVLIGRGVVRVVRLLAGEALALPGDCGMQSEIHLRLGLVRLPGAKPGLLEVGIEGMNGATLLAVIEGEQIQEGQIYRVALPLPDRDPPGSVTLTIPGPTEGALGIREAVVGPIDRIEALVAQCDSQWRGENEKKHFSAVYRDSFYAASASAGTATPGASRREFVPLRVGRLGSLDSRLRDRLSSMPPLPEETVFAYSLRLLQDLLPGAPPDFSNRIRTRAADAHRPLRILSLCSGAARIEQSLTAPCSSSLEIVLFDINEDLLRIAASGFAAHHRVSYVVGDINAGLPDVGEVDFVICVSALHHALQLERILPEINDCLMDDGQFLSIGEYIGRNGSRLWPREYELATCFFRNFEPRLRYHRFFERYLEHLPNDDCSLSSYEGARSEELLDLLRGHFVPVHEYLRNTFMWRLLDPALGLNFDLTRPDDLRLVHEIVAGEAANWLAGGRCTELHAVYGKKKLNVRV